MNLSMRMMATMDKSLAIIDKDYHRNGVSGMPFQVSLVRQEDEGTMVVIMFEQEGHTAVLNLDKLAMGDINFGSNSHRGDYYEEQLRKELWSADE